MIVDFDDFEEGSHRLDLLWQLKVANPLFRCTLFAIPGKGTPAFWETVPRWCQLAVHGWLHPDSYECAEWTKERTEELLYDPICRYFVRGFKAPGWQISQGAYEALLENGWWVADQPYNDERRPVGLRVHRLGDHDHWHGHIQNVCGNGLEETFDALKDRVKQATHFEWVSEMTSTWRGDAFDTGSSG